MLWRHVAIILSNLWNAESSDSLETEAQTFAGASWVSLYISIKNVSTILHSYVLTEG